MLMPELVAYQEPGKTQSDADELDLLMSADGIGTRPDSVLEELVVNLLSSASQEVHRNDGLENRPSTTVTVARPYARSWGEIRRCRPRSHSDRDRCRGWNDPAVQAGQGRG